MGEENSHKRHYKIEAGDTITLSRNDYNGSIFYKTYIVKKDVSGNFIKLPKNLALPSGTDLPDGTKIIIKDFFEDGYTLKNNPYCTNWILRITDFDVYKEDINEKIKEYNEKTDGNIDFIGLADEVVNEELPF